MGGGLGYLASQSSPSEFKRALHTWAPEQLAEAHGTCYRLFSNITKLGAEISTGHGESWALREIAEHKLHALFLPESEVA